MKNLLFHEVLLLSQIEKSAIKVEFSPETTIILGANDTGKSCLIKSLFQVFGAEPKIHPKWVKADVIKLLRFSINGDSYSILQTGRIYSVFDNDNNLVEIFDSVTKGLGVFFAELVGFKAKLLSKQGEYLTPPPAYYFLPFYVDQDKSWSSNWLAFNRLAQFSNWRKNIVEYHTGIVPSMIYDLEGKRIKAKQELDELNSELNIQNKVFKRFNEKRKKAEFDIDISVFKEEINELLDVCNDLKRKENKLKHKLQELNNQKIKLSSQIEIVSNSLNELKKDYDFATHSLKGNDVECPTCGANYSNSFQERFLIAKDESRCYSLLQELRTEYLEVTDAIDSEGKKYNDNLEEVIKISKILEHKKGQIKLKTLLELEGQKEAGKIFKKDINSYMRAIVDTEKEIRDAEGELGVFKKNNKKKREEILKEYLYLMKSFLYELDVSTLEEASYKRIDSEIKEQGSDEPRALLAYYFSILHIMRKNSDNIFCPIVIDSPNQQDQDSNSLRKMLTFIRDKRPENTQLILGSVETYSVKFDAKIIDLTNKYGLLMEDKYEEVLGELKPYLDATLLKGTKE